MEHFRKNFFFYILIFFIIIVGIISYNRFIINHDYMVEYEGVCDPIIEKCFLGYEEENNGEKEYYYSYVRKYAADLYAQCGKDIIDCESANFCLPDDRECSVVYCETGINDNICTTPTKELDEQNNNMIESVNEESLKDVNIDDTL